MFGVIPVRDDGIATLATEREFDTFYVIERLSEHMVSVDFN